MEYELKWRKEFEIGVYEIDAEHQIFLKIINKVDKAYADNCDRDVILRLLTELHKYADFHFISEENIMIENNYPDLKSHQKEHISLLSQLNEKISFFDPNTIDRNKLIGFLFNWFKDHTTTLDLKFGEYLKTKQL